MRRYKIVAQISLILSILDLVLAAPRVVQGIHEARGDEMVVAEDVTMMPKKWRELEAAPSDRSTSPRSSQDERTSSQDAQDAMASPQHSSLSDGSTSSGYPSPYLSSDESVPGYLWLLDRPPRLSLSGHLPASLHEPAPPEPASPHPSSSGPSEMPASPQLTWDWATSETYSSPHRFTPSQHPSSSSSSMDPDLWHSDLSMSTPNSAAIDSDGPLPLHYLSSSASEGLAPSQNSISEDLAPSQNLILEGLPSSPPPPPTERPPEDAEFLNENMVKTLKIVAGVAIIGGVIAIASIAGSQIKHRDLQDSSSAKSEIT